MAEEAKLRRLLPLAATHVVAIAEQAASERQDQCEGVFLATDAIAPASA
jgi:hypothetical protein